jgi:hypothetical protein
MQLAFLCDDISPVVLLEIAQIGGWLVFHSGHQQAVTGKIINLLADASAVVPLHGKACRDPPFRADCYGLIDQ